MKISFVRVSFHFYFSLAYTRILLSYPSFVFSMGRGWEICFFIWWWFGAKQNNMKFINNIKFSTYVIKITFFQRLNIFQLPTINYQQHHNMNLSYMIFSREVWRTRQHTFSFFEEIYLTSSISQAATLQESALCWNP